jgi:hypothetical protein
MGRLVLRLLGKASVLSLKAYAFAIAPDNRQAGWTG